MKPEFGLLLPIGLKPFNTKVNLNLIEKYIDSIWVRDLPVSSIKDGDLGSWYDPFIYLTHLSSNLKQSNMKFGIATINCSIRDPIITIKEVASLQLLLENKLLLGLGSSDKEETLNLFGVNKDEKKERLINFSNFAYKTLALGNEEDLKETTYAIPKNMLIPNFVLASSDLEVWKSIENVNEWMTRFLSPKIFEKKIKNIKKFRNLKSITLALNLILTNEENFKVDRFKGINCIFISPEKLNEFFKIYQNLGVTTFLISLIDSNNYIEDIELISQAINSLND